MSERDELREIKEKLNQVLAEQGLILARENKILDLLNRPTGGFIDILGDHMSTVAGTTSTFQWGYTPTGSVPPAGTTLKWTVDVTDITLTPSPDGTTCQAAVPSTETATSYNLTCTSSYTPPGAPTPITVTLNVPVTSATPLPTGGTITQVS